MEQSHGVISHELRLVQATSREPAQAPHSWPEQIEGPGAPAGTPGTAAVHPGVATHEGRIDGGDLQPRPASG